MKKMTTEQIDRLNELLVTDAEALTALFDEGFKTGVIGVVIGMAITVGSTFAFQKIRSECTKIKHKKEIGL